MSTIEIYYDEQDPASAGWAYRDTREGSPAGSGPIDGEAAACLAALDAGEETTEAQRSALREECAALRCQLSEVVMIDSSGETVGALFPAA